MSDQSRSDYRFRASEESRFTPDDLLEKAFRPGGFMDPAPEREQRGMTPNFYIAITVIVAAVCGFVLAVRFL